MPSREISREEMAVLALRAYAFASGQATSEDTDISSLHDAGQISVWALVDVKKTVALGLMKGNTQEQFKPKQHATRAEATQLIYILYSL
jgi:anti-sigma-K factor RskA